MSSLGPRADAAGKITRRQWLALSTILHAPRIAPITHLSFAELQGAGMVAGEYRRSTNGSMLTTKLWTITPAGTAAYRAGYAA